MYVIMVMRLDGRVVQATLKINVTVYCSCVNGDSLKHCNKNWCIIIGKWNIFALIEKRKWYESAIAPL